MRVSKYQLPRQAICPFESCVYSANGFCDDVRINKQNSDSDCHRITNAELLKLLNPVKS
jgi:hypothetical protein